MNEKYYYEKENYGFLIENPNDREEEKYKKLYKQFKQTNDLKVNAQRKRWNKIEKKIDEKLRDYKDIKKLVRKGIPPEYRGKVWFYLSGAYLKKKKNQGLYDKLLKQVKESEATKSIDKDLSRTFPEHPEFNQKSLSILKNVLYVYSIYNTNIEYCQSLNYIVGILILHYKNEEDIFWVFESILSDYLPSDLYSKDFNGLKVELYVLKSIMKEKNPKLIDYLSKYDIDFSFFATQWFLCLFIGSLPLESTLRILDSFFLEGYKILYRSSITILNMLEKDIYKSKNQFEILNTIKNQSILLFDCRNLMKNSFNIKRFSKLSIKNHRISFKKNKL